MHHSIFAIPVMALLSVTISACQPSNVETVNSSDWSCQKQSLPFLYSVCSIKAKALIESPYSLQLFWRASESDQPLLTFDNLLMDLPTSQTLGFAMNAGMYNENYAPIGYTVIKGEEIRALNLKEGGGNFHLLPNGVLWWDESNRVQITESNTLNMQLKNGQAKPWFATQSGPMLVIDNVIHPEFNPNGTSLKFRNGAGVCSDGSIQFVNSNESVSFYQFASLFKTELKCPNALFLDGGIASALYAPTIEMHDKKDMSVMVGLVEQNN